MKHRHSNPLLRLHWPRTYTDQLMFGKYSEQHYIVQECIVLVDSTRLLLFRIIEKESFRSSIIKIAELSTRLLLGTHEHLQEY